MRLENKTAIITGGASGIGLSSARAFCREGARTAIFGRRQDRLNQAKSEIGDNLLTLQGDVTNDQDTKRLVDETVREFGKIDILVHNAGVFTVAPLHEMADDAWDHVLNVNLRSIFKLTKEVLPHMMRQKSGNIIHISSILGLVTTPNASAYNASKGALNQFCRSIATEYGSYGIRSNAICPGLIETEMTEDLMNDKNLMAEWSKNYPIGRFGKPEDIANACLFLASEESSFITGAILPVDGGYTAL